MHKFLWTIFKNKKTTHEENIALIKASGLFDENWYRRKYNEALSGNIDPIIHYLKIGAILGYDPSPSFSSIDYIRANPDVGSALINPLVHYVKHGMNEGRIYRTDNIAGDLDQLPVASPFTELGATVRLLTRIVKARNAQIESLGQYSNLSLAEKIEKSGLFDREYYFKQNSVDHDLPDDLIKHFIDIGCGIGLKPNPDFEPDFYLTEYKDVASAGINPLVHFLEFGIFEGRHPSLQSKNNSNIALNKELVEYTSYKDWINKYDTINKDDINAMKLHVTNFGYLPVFSIIMPVYNTPIKFLEEAIKSVLNQVYPHWELCIANDASTDKSIKFLLDDFQNQDSRVKVIHRKVNGHISAASNSAIELATGDFIALMDHDDLIPKNALFEFAFQLNIDKSIDILYSDEDRIDENSIRSNPYFKTKYNAELMLSHNMVNHFGVYRRSLVNSVGGFRLGFEGSQDYDLILRVVDQTTYEKIVHIPSILYHWRASEIEKSYSEKFMDKCVKSAQNAIRDHLLRKNQTGEVYSNEVIPSWHRVIRSFPNSDPLVSIIIPTKDKAEILRKCCNSVLQGTKYDNFELIIVDHESIESETAKLFLELEADSRVKIIKYKGKFNYSAINNYAVNKSSGDLLCFLNNDVEVISSLWLREMAAQAILNDVGAVGAKLLYPDERLQHGGVILGVGGVAGHRFHLLSRDDIGPHGLAVLSADIAAITAACLVVRKSVFYEVGGFDEENLTVAFNDIDLCIKISQRGYRNIFNPNALLYHYESLSRGDDLTGDKQKRFMSEVNFMMNKWGDLLLQDPYYNPNLNISSADYSLSWPPRLSKAWLMPFIDHK